MTHPHPQSLVGRAFADPHDVWAWLDAHGRRLDSESVDVTAAAGRVPAGAIAATKPVPGTAMAATDGFALESASTVGASEYNPLPLHIAGHRITSTTTVRVVAGAPLPEGADAVLSLDDADFSGDLLEVTTPVAAGENVMPAGREAAAGDDLVPSGRRLGARDVALLLVAGQRRIDVVRRPRVGILCARDASLHAAPAMVGAMLNAWGCQLGRIEHADGDAGRFRECLEASDADLVVTIGATGAGDNDFAVDCLSRIGEVAFHGIAVHPGERTAVGLVNSRIVIQAPGLPLPCLVAAELFVRRAVQALSGLPPTPAPRTHNARLTRKIASRLGRLDVCRVIVDGVEAHPLAVADGTTLASAVRADGYVLVPVRSEGYDAGSIVTIHLFDENC